MAEDGKFSQAVNKSEKSGDSGKREVPQNPGHLSDAYEGQSPESGSDEIRRAKTAYDEPDGAVVMYHDKWGPAASQVRAVCHKILASGENEAPQVITMTSGTREEGKTIFGFNLAVALNEAQEGRVLVLDSDLRGPGVHRLAKVKPAKGLPEILRNGVDLDGNIQETRIEGLDVLASPHVAELDGQQGLLSQKCPKLLDKLRRHYAFIIVDTPPILGSSEARIFGKVSDGVLLLARLERTPRTVVKRSLEELKKSGANVLGCILTDRQHHIPNFLYSLLGNSSSYYYYDSYREEQNAFTEEEEE